MDIEKARHELGMTQAQLAAAIGVSERTVQNWEWGRTAPRPAQVKAIEQLVAEGQPVTVARLWAVIESQQRVIEALSQKVGKNKSTDNLLNG